MIYLPFIQIVTLPGMDTFLLKESFHGRHPSLGVLFWYKILVAFIFSVLIFTVFYSFNTSAKMYYFAFAPFVFLIPFLDACYFVKNRYLGSGRAKFANIIIAKFSVARLIIVLLIIAYNSIFELNIVEISVAFVMANTISPFYFFLKKKFYVIKLKELWSCDGFYFLKNGTIYTLIGALYTLSYSFDRLFINSMMSLEYFAYYSILVLLPIEFARSIDYAFPSFYHYFLKYKFLHKKFFLNLFLVSIVLGVLYYYLVDALYPFIFGKFYTYNFDLIFISIIYSLGLIFDFITIHFFTNYFRKKYLLYLQILNLIYYSIISIFMYSDFDLKVFIYLIFIKQFLLFIGVVYSCRCKYEKSFTYY
jgi:hypothetical protein